MRDKEEKGIGRDVTPLPNNDVLLKKSPQSKNAAAMVINDLEVSF